MAAFRRFRTGLLVPGTFLFPGPLEHFEVTALRRIGLLYYGKETRKPAQCRELELWL